MIKHSEEFKREAVRLALTGGLQPIFGDLQVHTEQVAGTVLDNRFDLSAAGRFGL